MADLYQTARWGICSDHSGSVALLVQTTKTINKWVGVTTWPGVIIAVGSSMRVSDAPSIHPVMPIMGLTGASTFFYIHGYTWPSKLPAKQVCWFIDLRFLISVSFSPHPNVGVRATLSVLLADRLNRTVRAQAGILCDSRFNQE